MAGFANLFVLGQPDPSQQLAALLSGQQQPGQQPPQGAGPPGAAPSAPGGPGAAPAPPTPAAYQSPPDLQAANQQLANPPNIMSLYMQMNQRDRAMQGINSALATIVANHSPPSMRQSIMQGIGGGGEDAGQTVGNLMNLYQAQNQMASQQALLQQAPAIAQKLGMDEGVVRAEIMAGRGAELIKSQEPTDLQRNYNWAHQKAAEANPNATPEQIDIAAQGILLGAGAGGMGGPEVHDRLRALNAFQANPANAGKPVPPYLLEDQKFKLFNTDLQDAKTQFNGINDALGGMVDKLGDVSSNPSLDKITGGLANVAQGGFKALVPGSPEYNLHSQMADLGKTAKALASRQGPKGLGQNLQLLGASPDDYTNYGIGDFRENVIAPKIKIALTAQANAYGASGQLAIMPAYLRPYLDKMYAPGGEFDPGGGFKPFTPSKDLKQPTAENMDDFKHNLEHFGPKKAIEMFKAAGIDTSSVE